MISSAPPPDRPLHKDVGRSARGTAHGEARGGPFSGRQQLILSVIAFAALALRMWRIGDWPLWVDEAHTWRDVTIPIDRFWDSARAWYPTSYLMLRGGLESGLLGETEGWLRLPFALLGAATVPLLATYGRHLVGRNAALLAAALLAAHPWHVYWSQNARGYVLVAFFAVIACGELWRGRVLGSSRRVALAWGSALTAASCQPSGALLLPVFVGAYAVTSSRVSRRGLRLAAISGIALFAVALPLLHLLPPFRNFVAAKADVDPSLAHLLQTGAWHFRVPLLLFAAVGAWSGHQGWTRLRARFLSLWAFLPLLLLAMLGSGIVKVTGRYAFASLPGLCLLASIGAMRIGDALSRASLRVRTGRSSSSAVAYALAGSLVALDVSAGSYLYFTVQRGDRAPWDRATLVAVTQSGGVPLVVHTTHEPILQYYLRRGHWRGAERHPRAADVRSIERVDVAFAGGGEAYVKSVVANAKAQGRAAFFLVVEPELVEKDLDGSLLGAIRRECELLAALPSIGGARDESIYVFRAR